MFFIISPLCFTSKKGLCLSQSNKSAIFYWRSGGYHPRNTIETIKGILNVPGTKIVVNVSNTSSILKVKSMVYDQANLKIVNNI